MNKLNKRQIGKVLAFDRQYRGISRRGTLSTRSLTYNLIVPHMNTRNPKKRDVTIARVAVKFTKDMKPMVKVIEFTDLSTATNDGKVTIHFRDMGFHTVAGWIVYWDSDEYEIKNNNAWYCTPGFGVWSTANYHFKCGLSSPFDRTINPEDLDNTKYRYCAFPGDEEQRRIGLLDWLMLYRADSRVELLTKAGIHALINPAGLKALAKKEFFNYVRTHLAEMQDASTHSEIGVKELLWCAKHNVSWQQAKDHFAFVTDMRRYLPSKASIKSAYPQTKLSFNYERLESLIFKWGIMPSEYARYIHEVLDAGLDTKCDGVLYPPVRDGRKSFMERLEKLEAENAKRHRKEERAKRKAERDAKKAEQEYISNIMTTRMKELADFQTAVDKVLHLNGAGYRCIVAKSQEELRKEGKRMNNCVGNGIYGKGIVLGDKLILQFKDEKGHSWCDAEIDRTKWTVRQVYARGNTFAPDEIRHAAKEIAKRLKAMHLQHRRNHTFPELERKVA